MKKRRSWWEKIKESLKVGKSESRKAGKKKEEGNDIPKEILDKLPPGVKIKKISIGPRQIFRLVLWAIIIFWLVQSVRGVLMTEEIVRVPLSRAIEAIKTEDVGKVTVIGDEVTVELTNEDKLLVASKEGTVSLVEILQNEGVDVATIDLQVENREGWQIVWEILTLVLTVGLPLLLIFWLFSKQGGGPGGSGGIFGFGKSRAKLFVKGKQKVSFNDVAGVEEAKKDLMEVVDFLKHPEKYRKMGARVPKGVLLIGQAGVGKTLLARAVAGEANVPFYSMAGSEFMEMLVGVGASRVRDLFSTAKRAGKAIIFIDEIDAIGRMRGGLEGGHGEREQTLNQILVEMDGFTVNDTIIVLAATNRGDLLDPALMRPGRFDRRIVLEMPDINDRQEILKIHARGKPFTKEVDWERVARKTVGFSGADLENMLNEAAIKAAREGKSQIDEGDIDEASLKVKLGAEKRRAQSKKDKLMTAYHEAGHAIVNFVEKLDPVQKVSIVSRGMALGFTMAPPKKDRVHETRTRLIRQMAMAMGGRAAEEMKFGDMTTGAAADISQATKIARNMVTEWGMGDLGPVNWGTQIDTDNWSPAYFEKSTVSDLTQAKVDEEVKKLVMTALKRAREVLRKEKVKLDELARVLVEKETVEEEEFEGIMRK